MSPRSALTPNKRKRYNKAEDRVFSENLQRLRLGKGLTQKDLARLIGVNSSRISEIEAGVFPGSRERLVALADALGCTCDELLRPKG